MKYAVECAYRTAEMIRETINPANTYNYIGNTIEADSAEEAIEIAMDYIAEQANANSDHHAEIEGESVVVYNEDDEIVEEYCSFTAKSI